MTILAAVDGNERVDPVVEIGKNLADAYDEELVLVHVMGDRQYNIIRGEDVGIVEGPGQFGYNGPSSGEERTYEIDDAKADAKSVADQVAQASLTDLDRVETKGLVGQPVQEILEEADRLDARYIVVGGRKRSSVGKAIFGSVTQSLLLESDRPVVTAMSE